MIDQESRRTLSQHVRQLVTGRMTNDQFDLLYYEEYSKSTDLAVREIACSCWGLYSSDLLFPYRLRGCHAVDPETRSRAARAVLFLRTELKFEWPAEGQKGDFGLGLMWGCAVFFGIPLSVVLLGCSGALLLVQDWEWGGQIAAAGLAVLLACIGAFWVNSHVGRLEFDAYRRAGQFDVWPFVRSDNFEAAKQSRHLLGKA